MRWPHSFFFAAALAACPVAHAASNCKLVRITEWEVRPETGRLTVEGAINGKRADILLDTGASQTLVLRAAAERLGLNRYESASYLPTGIGGETHIQYADIQELKIGTATRKNWRAVVLLQHDPELTYAVALGYDFFEPVDIEFDLAHNAVRLFQAKDCDGVSLAYWAKGGAGEVKLETDNERPGILVAIKLNGQPFIAGLDSGAPRSVMSRLLPATLGTLESFSIGDEMIRNPGIGTDNLEVSTITTGSRLSAVREARDMLLGIDFLRAHRVLVAHSQRKLYFTYTGGPVFIAPRP